MKASQGAVPAGNSCGRLSTSLHGSGFIIFVPGFDWLQEGLCVCVRCGRVRFQIFAGSGEFDFLRVGMNCLSAKAASGMAQFGFLSIP